MTLSDDEIERKARELLDGRIESVRALVHGAAQVEDLRTQLHTAERDYAALYSTATRSGWTAEELKKLGVTEPDVAQRRKRAAKKNPSATST